MTAMDVARALKTIEVRGNYDAQIIADLAREQRRVIHDLLMAHEVKDRHDWEEATRAAYRCLAQWPEEDSYGPREAL